MQITKPYALILSLLIHRQGGQYDADLVKISHGALSRRSIRSQLGALGNHNFVRREDELGAYAVGGVAPARWFITDAGRAAAGATQSLSADELVILQQAVQVAKDEQIKSVDALRGRLLAFYPGRETMVDATLARWAEYATAAAQ